MKYNDSDKYDKPMCGCGHGKATHEERVSPISGEKEFILHVLGEGTCCRTIAVGNMIPKNFRMEVWTSLAGTDQEETFLTEVCEVNNQTVTKYTLTDQRGFNYDEDFKVWSHLKKSDSINSIGDNW